MDISCVGTSKIRKRGLGATSWSWRAASGRVPVDLPEDLCQTKKFLRKITPVRPKKSNKSCTIFAAGDD
jgi:hypothetical protein